MDEAARNREIIKKFFEAAATGDDALDYLAEDATWWVPGGWKLGGTYRKDQLAAVFEGSYSVMDGRPHFTINAITAEDDRVALDCEGVGKFKDGVPFHNHYHFLFTLRDGKIVGVKEHFNTIHMAKLLEERL